MMKHTERKYSTLSSEYGLNTIVDPADPTVDIVFVHGLTGNCETTWTDPETKLYWPFQLLPNDIPTARILTFGYKADIVEIFDSHHGHTLLDHAADLAKTLARLRVKTETQNRPLIFVAHSLGGLLVEESQLFCHRTQDSALNAVLEATVAITYLGTPHVGTDLVRWERSLTYLATMLHKTDEHVQHILTPGAKVLAGIEKEFLTMVEARDHAGKRPLKLHCFYEALAVAGVGLVVPWHSGVLADYPHSAIRADHIGVARFKSRKDEGYHDIETQLSAWTSEFSKL